MEYVNLFPIFKLKNKVDHRPGLPITGLFLMRLVYYIIVPFSSIDFLSNGNPRGLACICSEPKLGFKTLKPSVEVHVFEHF